MAHTLTFSESLKQHSLEHYKLILLSPRIRLRNPLMLEFLESGEEIFFFTVATQAPLTDVLANMVENLRDFDPKFGSQTEQALKRGANVGDLSDAFVGDLKNARPKPRYLILDGIDQIDWDEDAYTFFTYLARQLPSDLQLVMNGRLLPFQPWIGLVQEGLATVYGDSEALDGGIFNLNQTRDAHLEVYGLVAGQVFVNGTPLTTWDGPLPRNLFYFFVDHPMVTRDEIFETFWPDLPTKEATNVFHVTKRKISERLGYELTAYSGGFYRPSGQMDVHYDAAIFEKIVEDNRLNPPENPAMWYSAIRLYRTPFLYRLEMPWMVKRREQIRLTYAEALIGIARCYRALNETDRAINFYMRAMREVPQREDIHRDMMSLYAERGDTDKAVAQYQLLSSILQRTLNIAPSKVTQAMFNKIKSGRH